MSLETILSLCRERDIALSVDGGDLRVSAPPGAVDDALRALLRGHKAALLQALAADEPAGTAIARLERREAPLSPWQRGLWLLHHRDDADLGTLHATAIFRLSGPIDRERLAEALARLASRQEALRLRFSGGSLDQARQHADGAPPVLAFADLDPLSSEARLDAEAQERIGQLARRRFDLAGEPLCRLHLLSAGAERHRLLFVGHHLLFDGWSVGLFLKELQALYRGVPAGLPPLPVQYLDCAAHFSRMLEAPEQRAAIARQAERLAGLPLRHGLITDAPRGGMAGAAHGKLAFELSAETTKQLTAAARAAGGSLFAALLAGLLAVFQHLTGQQRLSVMTPVANRALDPAVEPLIGCFANAVILTAAGRPEQRFADVLARLADAALDLLDHQALPHDAVLDAANLPREPGMAPAAQIFLALQDAVALEPDGGLRIETAALPLAFGRHDLSIEFRLEGEGLAGSLHYRGDLFDAATAHALADAYRHLLEEAAANPSLTLAELRLGQAAATPGAALPSGPDALLPLRHAPETRDLAERLAALLPPGGTVAWIGPLDRGRLLAARAAEAAGLDFMALPAGLPPHTASSLLRLGAAGAVLPAEGVTPPGWAAALPRPGEARAGLPTDPGDSRWLLLDQDGLVPLDRQARERRAQAIAAGFAALGMAPGQRVAVELSHASDEALELLDWLDRNGMLAESEPADHSLRADGGGQSTISYNHLPANGAGALLGDPRNGLLAVAAAEPGAVFARATPLASGIAPADREGGPLPAGLPGRLPSGQIARLTAEGALQLYQGGGVGGTVWHRGRPVDLDRLASRLLENAPLADAACELRQGAAGPSLIAWVVPDRSTDAAILADMIDRAAEGLARIDHVVRLAALPLDGEGRLDPHRLARLPIASLAAGEAAARSAGAAAQAVLRPRARSVAHAHVEDWLPATTQTGLRVHPAFAPLDPPVTARTERRDLRPALLPAAPAPTVFPADGWNPLDWLIAAARPGRLLRTIEPDGEERHTAYPALLDTARRLAGGLRAAGLGRGDRLLLSPRSPTRLITAFFASQALGITVVPVLPPRAWSPDDPATARIGHMVRLTEAGAILLDEPESEHLPDGLRPLRYHDLANGAPDPMAVRWARDEIALFAFTSGSTGLPKGVPLSSGNLWATPALFGPAFGFAADEVALNFTALDHVASLIGFCGSALKAGGQLAIIPVDRFLADPACLVERLARWRVARSWAPDFAWTMIAAELNRHAAGSLDLSTLRALFSAGECPLDATFRRLHAALARHGAGHAALQASFGMAETTSLVTLSRPWNGQDSHVVSTGVIDNGAPVPGTAARVVDSGGRPLGEGEMGQLQLRGPSVFAGYVSLDPLPPAVDAEGWFGTGDLAIIQAGRILIRGREKEVLILNGQNVAQVEVEDRIDALDGVDPSYSVSATCRDARDGGEVLIVFFVPSPANPPPEILAATIRKIAGTLGAAYGVRPDYVLPLGRADIPKTGLGKLQRTILRKRFEAGDFKALSHRIDLLLQNERTVPARLDGWTSLKWAKPAPAFAFDRTIILEGGDQALARHLPAAEDPGTGRLIVVDAGPAAADAGTESMRRLATVRRWVARAAGRPLKLVWPETHAASAVARFVRPEFQNASGLAIEGAGDLAALLAGPLPDFLTSVRLDTDGASIPKLAPLRPAAQHTSGLRPDSLVLVPGGAGAVGRVLLPRLLRWTSWRFLVLGRREEGGLDLDAERVTYRQADAGDPQALLAALAGERPAMALNLTGAVSRTPLAGIDGGTIERLINDRLRVAEALHALFSPGGGTVIHVTSILSMIGSQDFAGYGIANDVHRRWIAQNEGGPVRHVDLCCGQWQTADAGPLQAHLEQLGYAAIDGGLAAAAILRLLHESALAAVLGLDRHGGETGPWLCQPAHPLDRVVLRPHGPVQNQPALETALARFGLPLAIEADGAAPNAGLDATEQAIAAIWRELLGGTTRIQAETNFFDAGGTSLLAARLQAKLFATFGAPGNVVELFACPTPRAQARLVTVRPEPAPVADERRPRPRPASIAGRRRAARAAHSGVAS